MAAIACLAVALSGCTSPERRPTTTNPDIPTQIDQPDRPVGITTGEVTWIADGDTIDVDTENGVVEVRFLGVNTPEKDECYGDEPLQYLIDNIKGETVGLEIADEDQFGRTLTSVWLDDELINLTLVKEGYAIAMTPGSSDPHGSILLAAEEQAFDSGQGLWSSGACGGNEGR